MRHRISHCIKVALCLRKDYRNIVHRTHKCASDVTLDGALDMTLREVYNMFEEIYKALDMFSIATDTPLDRIIEEVV